MSKQTTFTVQPRTLVGKKVAQLRRQGMVPANVYGLGKPSRAIQSPARDFTKLYEEEGDTGLIYLQIGDDKKKLPVLIDEVVYEPVLGTVVHVAFKQVDLREKIQAEVPVEVVGEADVADGTVVVIHDSILVEALPTDLPESFEIDVSGFTSLDDVVTFADLSYDREKVTLVVSEEELSSPVVMIQAAKEEVEEEIPAESEAETAEGESAPEASQEETKE